MKVTTDACLFGAWVATTTGNKQWTAGKAKFLDVGAGTGLLSLMVAQKNKALTDAVEIDAAAAEQARKNIASSPWKDRISVIHTDVLQWQTASRYDCIFSNPPFYQNELRSPEETKNMARHDGGLKLNDLLSFIKEHLTDAGSFFLLLPAKRERQIDALLLANELFLRQKISVQQTPKHPPFRFMIEGSLREVESTSEATVSIKNENGNYTGEFVSLLQDYYLYL